MPSTLWFSIWRVLIVLLVGALCLFLIHHFVQRNENRVRQSGAGEDRTKRLVTLLRAGYSVGTILVVLLCTLMILRELGIDIAPILASAGVIGLAFSLGAQTIIKDFLGGVVILVENQFTIGDVISVGAVTGTVENITLRATYLRDAEGKLCIIPNGDIRSLANLTTKWSQLTVTLNFDYDTDMDRVIALLEEAARLSFTEEASAPLFLEQPSVLGWTGFTDWSVQAQLVAKTPPGKQWSAARILRRNALKVLGENGIQPAIPRRRVEETPGS